MNSLLLMKTKGSNSLLLDFFSQKHVSSVSLTVINEDSVTFLRNENEFSAVLEVYTYTNLHLSVSYKRMNRGLINSIDVLLTQLFCGPCSDTTVEAKAPCCSYLWKKSLILVGTEGQPGTSTRVIKVSADAWIPLRDRSNRNGLCFKRLCHSKAHPLGCLNFFVP